MKKQLGLMMLLVGSLTLETLAQISIEHIAPENTVFVVGADNVEMTITRARQTKLWEIWESDEFKELTEEFTDEFTQHLAEMYKELGVEEGSLTPPTGPAGLAAYTVMNEETGRPELAMLLFADYGEDAEKFASLVDALLEKMQEDMDVEFEEDELLGRNVVVIEIQEQEEDDEDMDFDDFDPNPLPGVDELTDKFSTLYYVRDGNRFFLGSELDGLQNALEAIDGEGPSVLADRDDFLSARAQLGESDAYGLFMTRDFGSVVDVFDESGMVRMMAGTTVQTLIGKVEALGFGYRLNGSAAMVEQYATLYMPEGKEGIFALLDIETPRNELPSFIGADAISYSYLNFNFNGLVDFVREIVQSNPMLGMQIGQNMPQIEEAIMGLCNPLGTKVHMYTTLKQPIAADSLSIIFAIECKDPEKFEEFIAEWGVGIGMEPRDFLGHRIYSYDMFLPGMGDGTSFALGLSGGYLFLGGTDGVEQALRSAGQNNLVGLGGDKEFHRALDSLDNDPMTSWGYSDFLASMAATLEIQKFSTEDMIREMEEIDPEMAAELKAELLDEDGFLQKLDIKYLSRFIGPAAWQVRSTEEGLIMTSYILEASGKD